MQEPRSAVRAPRQGTRQTLIDVALEVVDEGGAALVSVREVARRAGVSSGAPFRHFADREALLDAVAEAVAKDFFAAQTATAAQAERHAYRAVGLGVVRYARDYPHRFALLRSAMYRPTRSPTLDACMTRFESFVADLIRQGQEVGELRAHDPALIRLAGQALAYGLAQMVIEGHIPEDGAEELTTQALDLFGIGVAYP